MGYIRTLKHIIVISQITLTVQITLHRQSNLTYYSLLLSVQDQ